MNAKELKDLSVKELDDAQTKIAASCDEVKKTGRSSDRKTALRRLKSAIEASGDGIIRVLQPDYVKRGAAGERWALLTDKMLVSEYVASVESSGGKRGEALRDLRYNKTHGLISIVGV